MKQLLTGVPVLSLMTFLPVLGMMIIALIPKERVKAIRFTGTLVSGIVMILSFLTYFAFDPNAPGTGRPGEGSLQFVEHFVWIESFRIEYFMGVDGISISMVLLTGLIGFVGAWSSWNIQKS